MYNLTSVPNVGAMWDSIAATGPLVTFELLVLFGLYQYMKKEIEKKDAIIKLKDEKLEALNIKLVDVIERQLEATIKGNQLIDNLKDLLREALNKNK